MPSIPPYFKTMYPDQANDIHEGYSDMGRYMAKGLMSILRRFNPFRTP